MQQSNIQYLFLFGNLFWICDAIMRDVCINNAENLSLKCDGESVIVTSRATFGRMRLGRCVGEDYKVGCGTDVLVLVDRWCSGKRNCDVNVPNKDLIEANQCSKELVLYLEVEYECVHLGKVPRRDQCSSGQAPHTTHTGQLYSIVADETGCGSIQSPLVIEGAPGQRVNISMLDFAYTPTSSGAKASTMTCKPYGYIVERKLGINRTVCGGVARRSHVHMSASSSVEIHIRSAGQRPRDTSFVINYAVVGCSDAKAPDNAWYRRIGDVAEMGCEWSDSSWKLKCVGGTWVGKPGNCSAQRIAESKTEAESFVLHPVLSMGLIIGLASLIAVLICVISIGFCLIKRRKNDQGQSVPSTEAGTIKFVPRQPTLPGGTGHRTQGAGQHTLTAIRKQQGAPMAREGTTNSDLLLHGWDTATTKRRQPGCSESEYLAPCLTGSYLAEKYGAPIYDTVGTRNGTGERNSSAGNGDWVQEANFQFLTTDA